MGTCILRPPYRHQTRPEKRRRFSQKNAGRRLSDVPVQHIHAPLQQPRKRRGACATHQKKPAAQGQCGHNVHHRQAIWDDGNIPWARPRPTGTATTAIRIILKQD